MVGEINRGVAQLIVRKIEPGEDLTATITAVDASPAVWTADGGVPPAFVSDITGKAWCSAPAPPIVHIRTGDSAPNDAGVIKELLDEEETIRMDGRTLRVRLDGRV